MSRIIIQNYLNFCKTYECTNSYVTKLCMYSYTILFYFRTFRPFTLSCSHGSPQICPNLVCPSPHRKNSVALQILISAFHNKHHSSTFIFNCIANTIPPIIPVSPQLLRHHSGKVHVSIHFSSEMIQSTTSYIIIPI